MKQHNPIQDLEEQKRKANADGNYKLAKEIQDKLDMYYWGRKVK